MWRYEGRQTLDYYLKRRDCSAALAEALGVDEPAVVPTVMAQVLTGVSVRPPNPTRPISVAFAEASKSGCYCGPSLEL